VTIADVARMWQANGVSIVPIQPNGTKRAAVEWGPYQAQAPTLDQVNQWWSNGQSYGLALICGAVSGNLEMLELEGRATNGNALSLISTTMAGTPVEDLWQRLTGDTGYMEWTPSGGIHLLYRIIDHPVPGNTKIARRPSPNPPGWEVLAETRGEGGYVVVAPTSGLCHPTGESWELLAGRFGRLPVITWEERNLLHDMVRLALDETPVEEAPPTLPALPGPRLSVGGLTPGDDFEASTDWSEILEPHGWTLESRHGPERHWTRPGKDRRDGSSATTGRAHDRERLYVFSTSTVFNSETPYTKFGAYALLNFGGDHSAAARALVRQGFGERSVAPSPAQELEVLTPRLLSDKPEYVMNDSGNAHHLYDRTKDTFRWVPEIREFRRWDGRVWAEDTHQTLLATATAMTEEFQKQALDEGDEKAAKWWVRSGNRGALEAMMRLLQSRLSVSANDFDTRRHLVTTQNGVLNLDSGELRPHDSAHLLTKAMAADFQPDAKCPQFEAFMTRVLPDAGMRGYVQRALGYTLLGDADQRAMFLIYGPSGTGKSTLMSIMSDVFGDYAGTAPSGTLRAQVKEQGPSNDLHSLRGRRFVSTSETNEGTLYNEDLIKRLTGRDKIVSRDLYEKNQEWTPVCTLWLATNHPPRFTTDDDAIWRRIKLIPFTTVLIDEDEVPDFARSVLSHERDGILNWLLAGLQDFLAHGLGEPPAIMEAVQEQRLQSDPVAQFLADKLEDGALALGQEVSVKITDLYSIFSEWARQVGERPMGSRRFNQRMRNQGQGIEMVRVGQMMMWTGIGRAPGTSLLGTMRTGWGLPAVE